MLICDPYNFLSDAFTHEYGDAMMSNYLNTNLQKIKHFSYERNVHTVLIPHPKQMQPFERMLDFGQINGGAAWGNKIDNILFVNTTLNTATNEEQRVIYLRDTLQWQAGSTFEGIDPIIPLSAEAYRSAVQRAIAKIDKDQTTDVSTRHKETEEIVFADVMKEVTEYAKGFHAAKQMEEITQISNDVFGLGNKITQATEDQVELLVSALEKIKDKASKLGITI